MGDFTNNLYTSTGQPEAGTAGRSSPLRTEFDLIERGFEALKTVSYNARMADANTAGSIYVMVGPSHGGDVVNLTAVNEAANADTDTVYTFRTKNSASTIVTWQHLAADAAEVIILSTITASPAVLSNTWIKFTSDGGGTPVMPVAFTAEIILS